MNFSVWCQPEEMEKWKTLKESNPNIVSIGHEFLFAHGLVRKELMKKVSEFQDDFFKGDALIIEIPNKNALPLCNFNFFREPVRDISGGFSPDTLYNHFKHVYILYNGLTSYEAMIATYFFNWVTKDHKVNFCPHTEKTFEETLQKFLKMK